MVKDSTCWPQLGSLEYIQPNISEQKFPVTVNTVNMTSQLMPLIGIERFISLTRLLRVTAWILRYVNLKNKEKLTGPLSAAKVQNEQKSHFKAEANCVKKKEAFPMGSSVRQLRMYFDNEAAMSHGMSAKHRRYVWSPTSDSSAEALSFFQITRPAGTRAGFSRWCSRRFNPNAPWWDGFYEMLVRSVKTSLRKMLERRPLSRTKLSTLLTEIETVIKSQSLTFVFDEPYPCPQPVFKLVDN